MLFAILSAVGVTYCLIFGLFAIMLFRQRLVTRPSWKPKVTVIVPARNEARNIGACLESLGALRYPPELLEVIIVDDFSNDGTPRIINTFVSRLPHLKLVRTNESVDHLRGKTRAIAQGVDYASGEVLFFTDADCRVPHTWIEETLKYYDERAGLVAGFTDLPGRGVFSMLQALDWFTLFSAASAAASMGFPVTAVGNNLSIRKSVYDAIGGYRNIDFSVTEDLALVRAATSRSKSELRFPIDPATLVESAPCDSWREWYGQRKRWFVGGRKMRWGSQLVLVIVFFFNILLVWSLIADPVGLAAPWLTLKLVADTALVIPALRQFHRMSLLRFSIFYQIYFAIHIILLTVATFFQRSIRWKDRDFEPTHVKQKKKALVREDEG
jgi:cellulose synthase/poly-beta-1,6-N-acetylglucosamine synthase-like glycosyltransferase